MSMLKKFTNVSDMVVIGIVLASISIMGQYNYFRLNTTNVINMPLFAPPI